MSVTITILVAKNGQFKSCEYLGKKTPILRIEDASDEASDESSDESTDESDADVPQPKRGRFESSSSSDSESEEEIVQAPRHRRRVLVRPSPESEEEAPHEVVPESSSDSGSDSGSDSVATVQESSSDSDSDSGSKQPFLAIVFSNKKIIRCAASPMTHKARMHTFVVEKTINTLNIQINYRTDLEEYYQKDGLTIMFDAKHINIVFLYPEDMLAGGND